MLPGIKRMSTKRFTEKDDARLKKLVKIYGTNNWNELAKHFESRNARQCRDRWEKYLSPSVRFSPFTLEEDKLLLKLHEELGAKWVQISKYIKGRSDVSLKARYRYLARRNISLENIDNMQFQNIPQVQSNINNMDNSNITNDSYDFDYFSDFDQFFDFSVFTLE